MQGVILCLFYIAGLLSTAKPETAYGLPLLGIVAVFVMPKIWRSGPRSPFWILTGTIGFMAAIYFQLRVPQPSENDISHIVVQMEENGQENEIAVRGEAIDIPQLNRNNKVRFTLAAKEVINGQEIEEVAGKVYATVPLLQGTGLHPGLEMTITGQLYLPPRPKNPKTFSFKEYLSRQGVFAGISGFKIDWDTVESKKTWGLWKFRKQIVQAQLRSLGSPEGQIVSAMVMGRKAVDLPYDIRDRFIRVGLAHALAASGFHVSLILGLVLVITKRYSEKVQFITGTLTLISYVSLVGLQPSILRAAIMGFGGLIALATERKVKPVSGLILAGTILLLWNPLWIWNVGFQLSFSATFGLLTTAGALSKRLDFLPEAIATVFAVPIAATIWTLPIQMFHFNVVATYSIVVNVITVPFLSLITIAGFVSAVASLIYSPAGSAIAWLLEYPMRGLMAVVDRFYTLPGSRFSVGSIAVWQLFVIYGMMLSVWSYVVWQNKRKEEDKSWQRLPFVSYIGIAIASVTIVLLPLWQAKADLFHVTVLETGDRPILVIENGMEVVLINSGDEGTVRYTVVPFLQQEAINQIGVAVATGVPKDKGTGWLSLLSEMTIKKFYRIETAIASDDLDEFLDEVEELEAISVGKSVTIGKVTIAIVSLEPNIWRFKIGDRDWLLLEDTDIQQQNLSILEPADVLLWSGRQLRGDLLETVNPEVAIAYSSRIDEDLETQLVNRKTQFLWTQRDGNIIWTQDRGFETTAESGEDRTYF